MTAKGKPDCRSGTETRVARQKTRAYERLAATFLIKKGLGQAPMGFVFSASMTLGKGLIGSLPARARTLNLATIQRGVKPLRTTRA